MWKERLLANLDLLGLRDALISQEEDLKKSEDKLEDTKLKGVADESDSKQQVDVSLAEKQRKVRSTIIMYVTDQILRKIIKEKTAVGMLKILDAQYMSTSLPNRMHLKQCLYGYRMNESLTIENNIDEFLRIITDLSNVMVEISDEDQAILLLMSLPKQFDQLRDTLRYSKTTVTLDEVISSIHSKQLELGVNGNGKGSKSQGEVLYSSSNNRGRSGTRDSNQSKFKGKGRSKSRGKGNQPTCWTCGAEGHFKRNCPKRSHDRGKEAAKETGESSAVTGIKYIESLTVSEVNVAESYDYREIWIMDTGCSFHMTPRRDWFIDFEERDVGSVRMANESTSSVKGIGTVRIKTSDGSFVLIKNVRYIPQFSRNLLSLGVFESEGCSFSSEQGYLKLTKGCRTVLKAKRESNLYFLQGSSHIDEVNLVSVEDETSLWHSRLGHVSQKGIDVLVRKGLIDKKKISTLQFCESCIVGKAHRVSFGSGQHTSKACLEYVHADLWGSPTVPQSLGNCHYFLSIIDDHSRKVWIYFLKTKDQAFDRFADWKTLVEKQSGLKVKTLRTDNGLEFCNKRFDDLCSDQGIARHKTIPYTPQQNGVVERMNRTVLERVRSMLDESGLPKVFWAEAANTAVYLINRTPSAALQNEIPEEIWSKTVPQFGHLKKFGCVCYHHSDEGKLQPRAKKGIFIGYPTGVKGYKVWSLEDKRSIISTNVTFKEDECYKDLKGKSSEHKESNTNFLDIELSISKEKDMSSGGESQEANQDSVVNTDVIAVESSDSEEDLSDQEGSGGEAVTGSYQLARDRSRREPKPPKKLDDYVYLACMVAEDGDMVEPSDYKSAMRDPHRKKWILASDDEMDSLQRNHTWDLVKKPKGRAIIGCKWIYKRKPGILGVEDPRYKGRLVAKGYAQKEGVDYNEIFSPVVKHVSIRYLMSIVVQEDMELEQLDVKTAFLHGDLEEEIYMTQPEGYEEKGKEDWVCRLRKSLYGLKQSPRQWNKKFDEFMKEIDFKRSCHDQCVYIKRVGGVFVYLLLYVDDMLLASKDMTIINNIKDQLSSRFEMKDLGAARKILGIEIIRDRAKGTLILSQESYMEKVLKTYSMENAKSVNTPIGAHFKLMSADPKRVRVDEEYMRSVPYCNAVGSLMYGMIGTRPDLAYPVGLVSRFMSDPVREHWDAVKWILRYVNGTRRMSLKFERAEEFKIVGFCDSDFGGDLDRRRSISGYTFLSGGCAISWRSSLQKVVALSTTESEYISLTEASKEAIWLMGLSEEFGYKQANIEIFCDSQSARALAKNNVHHERTKHMARKLSFVRELVEKGEVQVSKVHTDKNLADTFTKVLPVSKFKHLLSLLGASVL